LLLLSTDQTTSRICGPASNIANTLGGLASGISNSLGRLADDVSKTICCLLEYISSSVDYFAGCATDGSKKTALAFLLIATGEGVVYGFDDVS
jgi:hypothetical protein